MAAQFHGVAQRLRSTFKPVASGVFQGQRARFCVQLQPRFLEIDPLHPKIPVRRSRQCRFQSTSTNREKSAPAEDGQSPPSFGRFLLRALSLRHLTQAFRSRGLRKLFRQSPEEFVLAVVMCVISLDPTVRWHKPETNVLQSCRRRWDYSVYCPNLLYILLPRAVYSIPGTSRQITSKSFILQQLQPRPQTSA